MMMTKSPMRRLFDFQAPHGFRHACRDAMSADRDMMKTFSSVSGAVKNRFQPALLCVFRGGYSRAAFAKDLLAGVIVAIVAIPLAIAFAIASGVSPQQGFVTAVVAGFLISAFSGSRVQIGGPTGAFIIIIYGIVQKHGYDGLAVATIMAGAILVAIGAFGFGSIIKYIPYPVAVGFTAGIAIVIFTGQIKDILGLRMDAVPADFVGKLEAYWQHLGTANAASVLISAATVLICVYWKRVTLKIPGSLVAILLSTLAVALLRHFHALAPEAVSTIGDRFPDVAAGMRIPVPRIPVISFATFREMVSPAISIALLAGIESLLSAIVADGMTGQHHHSNTELIAQGIANLCSPLFGGIPATGAIARTATNIKSGGTTPVAGIVHACVLLLVMLFLGRFAALIPMAALGGIVAFVAYNMSEVRSFLHMFKSTKSDAAVMVITFLLTVFIDLVVAIQAGILLAMILFIRRTAEATQTRQVTQAAIRNDGAAPPAAAPAPDLPPPTIPPGVEVFEIEGVLFFGAVDKFKSMLAQTGSRPKTLILNMRHVLAVDASALHVLEDVLQRSRRDGIRLILCGVHSQPLFAMQRAQFLGKIGDDNLFWTLEDALRTVRP